MCQILLGLQAKKLWSWKAELSTGLLVPEAAAGYMWGRGKGSRSQCPNPLLPSSFQNKEKFSNVDTTLLIMNNTYSHQSIWLKRNLNGADTAASPSVSDSKPFEARGRLFTDFDVRLISYFGLLGDRFSQPNFCIRMSRREGDLLFLTQNITNHRKMGI